ncbi:MAG: putative dithiol-disulfide isomerase involved in polyketide biosynthesis [Deltaproteobacteria bacterium]|nr:putative dithiol-disulfide isomerase involved in polyketide biosynthesis [Deltaproteobacteria bacterium]
MPPRIQIHHFSDVLCVWAYIAQRRMDELRQEFGDRVDVDHRLVDVFGFARVKLEERWKDKGGLAGYAGHVREVVARFDHVALHEDAWARVAPSSSWPAHLVLAAIRSIEAAGMARAGTFVDAAWLVREAFFRDARDISQDRVVFDIVEKAGVDQASIRELLATGAAHAELARDYDKARAFDVRISPSIVMNEGRQHLNGNVGYRVIAANLKELLERSDDQLSWC